MNSQSKTQTNIPDNVIYPSFQDASNRLFYDSIQDERIRNGIANYSNDSSTFSKNPFPVRNFSEKKEHKMDENDMLKAYMEKVDRDQSDLRADIRESERRTSEQISKMEERMDLRLNRIEDMIQRTLKDNSDKVDSVENKMRSMQSWVTGTCVATIIGIAAMVIAVLVA